MFSFPLEGPSVAFLLPFHDSCFSGNISIYFSFLKNSFAGFFFFLSSRTFNLVIFLLFFFKIFEREKKSADIKAPLFVTSCFSLYLRLWVFVSRGSHIVQAGLECSNICKDVLELLISCFHLTRAVISGVCHQKGFM